MKITTTSARLKEIMAQRGLRQVDILEAAKPFCAKYGVKLAKNDLSQYVSGKVEPGQEKLTVLGLALGVSETWLMGYDVIPARGDYAPIKTKASPERTITDRELKFALWGDCEEIDDADLDDVRRYAEFVRERKRKK